MHGGLLGHGGVDLGDVLQTVAPMATTVELTFSALILRLLAVLNAMPVLSTIEALVASWYGRASFTLLLLIVP